MRCVETAVFSAVLFLRGFVEFVGFLAPVKKSKVIAVSGLKGRRGEMSDQSASYK